MLFSAERIYRNCEHLIPRWITGQMTKGSNSTDIWLLSNDQRQNWVSPPCLTQLTDVTKERAHVLTRSHKHRTTSLHYVHCLYGSVRLTSVSQSWKTTAKCSPLWLWEETKICKVPKTVAELNRATVWTAQSCLSSDRSVWLQDTAAR